MTRHSPIRIYDWIRDDFTSQARTGLLDDVGPVLEGLCGPGSRVLDLCCGGGAVSFFLETRGATVTGLDFSPELIDSAKHDARKRKSAATFLLADILKHDLGDRQYDLALLLGNCLQDIPHQSFLTLRDAVWRALEDRGHFVLDLFDGVLAFSRARDHPEETIRETPETVTRSFKRYDPSLCAYVEEYRNVPTGESYEYTSRIYTGPVVDMAIAPRFALESRVGFEDGRLLSVYGRRAGAHEGDNSSFLTRAGCV
jgi:SAM-dependent methyltransferase